MKRNAFLILALVLLLALALTGCAAVGNQVGSVGADDETTPNPAEGMVASVTMNDTTTYYATFGEALSTANSYGDCNITLALLQDIGPDEMCDVGRIAISERTQPLTLDLNNHTINRGLATPSDYGAVFNLQKKGTVVIKNGTVTGGNCSGDGGCFYIGNEGLDLTLENLIITGNHAAGKGSAIYLAATRTKVTLNNVSIKGNSADGSGAVFWAIYDVYRATLTMKNTVEISGNSGSGSLNNLVYDGKGWCGWLNTDSMSTGSKIGVSYSDGYGGPIADSFGSRLKELKKCFFADQGDHDITSGNGTLVVKFKTDKAAVIHNGEWSFFNTFAQTWASANGHLQSKDATMVLFGNWVADSDGSFDDNGGYGGSSYFKEGAIHPLERDNNSWLILDLNGHTINAQGKHRIVFMDEGIRMNIKNGTLTGGLASGGGNDGRGGAIWIDDGDIQLDLNNMVFTGNKSTVDGAAIAVDIAESVNFNTVTVENNYVDSNSHKACAVRLEDCDIRMFGKILIRNNDNKNSYYYDSYNLSLGDYIDEMGDINTDMKGSEIGLSYIDTAFEWDWEYNDNGHRDITEDNAVLLRNYEMFVLNAPLRSEQGYKRISYTDKRSDDYVTLTVYNYR